MRLISFLKEDSELEIKDESHGHSHGQSDNTLTAFINGEQVGYLDYSVYNGKPSIKFISVDNEYKRKGFAKRLIQYLQNEYPDEEIDWGMLTNDGVALKNSVDFDRVPSEYAEDFNRLEQAIKRRDQLQVDVDAFHDLESPTDKDREAIFKVYDEYNDLNDEIDSLESSLYNEKPFKLIVRK